MLLEGHQAELAEAVHLKVERRKDLVGHVDSQDVAVAVDAEQHGYFEFGRCIDGHTLTIGHGLGRCYNTLGSSGYASFFGAP